jgi:hypothetical protein
MPTACTTEKTGKYDGISSVYRIKFSSAFVVDPEKPMDIPIRPLDEQRKRIFESIKASTIKGVETRIPQPVPPGTGEAAYPGMERGVRDLPSKDFFLRVLDRPALSGRRGHGQSRQSDRRPGQPHRQGRQPA